MIDHEISAAIPSGFTPQDQHLMKMALKQAEKAAETGETPIGAVIVLNGKVIGLGRNRRELRNDATEHAEMMAIRQACRRLRSWRLLDCDLYVTLEPCLMCTGAIINARIRHVIYAAADPKAGACGSIVAAQYFPLMHQTVCEGGLMALESAALLRSFFRMLRTRDHNRGTRGQRRDEAAAGGKRLIGRLPDRDCAPILDPSPDSDHNFNS